jgi:molecular chaperone GrpE (heat shock protein)
MEIFISGNDQFMLAPPDLKAEIERLQEELLIEREQNLRTLADFRNYRRRVEHDVLMLAEVSQQGMINPVRNIINDMRNLYVTNNLVVINLI